MTRPIKVSAGDVFGTWVVISELPPRRGVRIFECVCGCGKSLPVLLSSLSSGRSSKCKDCSCIKHDMRRTREYKSWEAMRSRCNNPNGKNYLRYGAKGITVCKEWDDFKVFFADMGPRPIGKSLDRINGKLGYFKENCRWATDKEQANNRAGNCRIEYQGESLTYADLAERLGVTYTALQRRVKRHGTYEKPTKRVHKKKVLPIHPNDQR